MKSAVKLEAGNKTVLTMKRVAKKQNQETLPFLYHNIGCSCIDIVRIQKKGFENYLMVVDDEGLFSDNPEINILASWLYGVSEHGQPIVGNVIVMKEEETDEGADLAFLDDDESFGFIRKVMDSMDTINRDLAGVFS